MEVRWLGAGNCHDGAVVGGKAASLSRLASAFPVPPGFVVPALAVGSALAPAVVDAIDAAYVELGFQCGDPEPSVAVRSSALDEDGAESSFAGQHDTYLNVRGARAVVDAVHRCIQSAASVEAVSYRSTRGLTASDIRIAVLVQQLVPADAAAVAFSANPVTGDRDELMITSNWGLGESVVGGTVTPDTFVVRKAGLQLGVRDIAFKTEMTVRTELGTTEVPVPAELQTLPSLDDSQIRHISEMTVELEQKLGHAVDLECAFAAGKLYLLQCRPITTL